jgi:hypothetical protein
VQLLVRLFQRETISTALVREEKMQYGTVETSQIRCGSRPDLWHWAIDTYIASVPARFAPVEAESSVDLKMTAYISVSCNFHDLVELGCLSCVTKS